ncbi:MAG: enoyl-CoA hydratase/isomerase family protein [Vicinamibacterales bacterium]
MTAADTIFQIDLPLAVLTFNRPQARNAMTWGMYDALIDACEQVDRDDGVRVLILRGAGGQAFVAGTDISQFQQFRTPADGVTYERHITEVLDRLEQVRKPTIAQIEGFAVGGGCAIAVACDVRVATPESKFGVPIARTLGNCVTGAAFSRLVELVGPGHAKEMLFTGRLVPAAEALAMGMLNRVVPADVIGGVVRELATEIASNAPLTVRATKEMTRRLMALRRIASGDARDLIEMCYGSADFQEGVAAFLAKRPPRWSGR